MNGLDLGPSIRAALLADAAISGLITEWEGEAAILTRRPTLDGLSFPFIIVSEDVAVSDLDGLTSRRPTVVKDIITYGHNPDDYRLVEQIGYLIRELFHREKSSISDTDYHIIDIVASGPSPAPTSDEETIGRVVTLTIQTRIK